MLDFDLNKTEVPDDLDAFPDKEFGELTVICNPSLSWPFVAAPVNRRGGRITGIRRRGAELVPFQDWVPSQLLRPGGSLFFNPNLRLRTGEVLVAQHANGKVGRVTITKAFATVAQRKKRSAPKEDTRPSAFDRLLDDDMFED